MRSADPTLQPKPQGDVRVWFCTGLALVSVIPILTVLLLTREGWLLGPGAGPLWPVVALTFLALAVLGGILMLWRVHSFIRGLRSTLEDILQRDAPHRMAEIRARDETEAVENSLRLIISDLKDRLGALEAERERLQNHVLQAAKMEALRTMAMGVAHDLNNLLAAILGNVSIIIRHLGPGTEPHENAVLVESTALQAVELANRIMLYAGRSSWRPRPVNLAAVIEEAAPLLNVTVSRGTKIEYHVDSNLPMVIGDPAHLRQILINLVVNASDACPDRGGLVRVGARRLECDDEFLRSVYLDEHFASGAYVALEVSDNGCGMSPEVRNRMFDPFFTTKIRAHGLGLAVVMGLARLHRAAIRVESSPGAGTTVQLLFGLASATQASDSGAPPRPA